jgi:hypothetical protein
MRCNGKHAQQTVTQKVKRKFSEDVYAGLFFLNNQFSGYLNAQLRSRRYQMVVSDETPKRMTSAVEKIWC